MQTNLKNLLLKVTPVLLILLYLCLRTNVQCFHHPDGPHTHYFALKQKLQNKVPLQAPLSDAKMALPLVALSESYKTTSPPPQLFPHLQQISAGTQHPPIGLHDRAPPLVSL